MKLYLRVTKDKYRLPVAVADSVTELSRMTHVSCDTIYQSLSRSKRGIIKDSQWVSVEVDR